MSNKIKFLSSLRHITKIEMTLVIPKGILITKSQRAFGNICEELDKYDLSSITLSSHSTDKASYHDYTIIFNRTFERTSDISLRVRHIFENQDWGEVSKNYV